MKLTVLVDNNTYIDQYYLGEPALSYLVETEGAKILFDTGYSEIFLENARRMGISLSDLTHLVISHGHNDHTWGLPALLRAADLSRVRLVAHPKCFDPKRYDGEEIGSPLSLDALKERMAYIPAQTPYWIGEDCVFLGEIPTLFPFEQRRQIGLRLEGGQWLPDLTMEDSALVCKTIRGLFVITACSHSGICSIIEYAKQVCREERVWGVIGGFHLLRRDDRLTQTIRYLSGQNIQEIYPAHCVSLQAKLAMGRAFPIHEVGVGLTVTG